MSSFHRTASSSLVNLSSMQFQDENSQPRDRRPWTEEEDEKLRVAIEQGIIELPSFIHISFPTKNQLD